MSDNEAAAVVIECGSLTCKAGLAGGEAPSSVFRSVVGRPKVAPTDGLDVKDSYAGDEAWRRRTILRLKYPIEYGIVTNWDDMEAIWQHTFYNELRVAPEEHPVLLIERVLNPQGDREKMTQIMFETYVTPALYISSAPVLALYASGCATGVVIDSGAFISHVVPVYEGHVLSHAILRPFDGGGRELTEFFLELLTLRGISIFYAGNPDIVHDIKEKLCYIALDVETEMQMQPLIPLTVHINPKDDCLHIQFTNLSGSEVSAFDMEVGCTFCDLWNKLQSEVPDADGLCRILLPNGLDLSQLKRSYPLDKIGKLSEATLGLNSEEAVYQWVVLPKGSRNQNVDVHREPSITSEAVEQIQAGSIITGTQQGEWVNLTKSRGFVHLPTSDASGTTLVREAKRYQKTYELPDLNILTVGSERFRCPEAIFQPSLLGRDSLGLHEITFQTILRCNEDIHQALYSNILPAGGNTMFPGFDERMTKELRALAPAAMNVRVLAPPNRNCSAWVGGSMLVSELSRAGKWILNHEYDEEGPEIVERKCPRTIQ